jgi:hypothetical protein
MALIPNDFNVSWFCVVEPWVKLQSLVSGQKGDKTTSSSIGRTIGNHPDDGILTEIGLAVGFLRQP